MKGEGGNRSESRVNRRRIGRRKETRAMAGMREG
jgi:hypothetical protein